ncbi:hypothetical protein GDO86_020129 [Hymenochirus boettgeri]|uniref:Olfactory receptor n=1 Tax=Hymenochirus boettgeri TaxID=247094 RepID=A0A8T2IDM6_9PIPI|nr:hypothetical protein GDO86_020129 [Hymenochirus boettgeri]
MMLNSTYSHPSVLTLSFGELSGVKYFYGTLVLICFVLILLFNCTVIMSIALHRSLHEAMYIFIVVLCINGLYGSVAFLPSLFVNLISKTQDISYTACLIQVFGLHTYGASEMTILAIMAFDRYVCICNPLRYNTIITLTIVFKLISAAWLISIVPVTILILLTFKLPLCGSLIQKAYCDNWSVVKLSCIDTTVNNIYGLFITVVLIGITLGLIFVSYLQILRVCLQSSKRFKAKAVQTCTPHLILLCHFALGAISDIILNRLTNFLNFELRTIISVQGFVIAPLLNPLIYGLKLREIRVRTGQIFYTKRTLRC